MKNRTEPRTFFRPEFLNRLLHRLKSGAGLLGQKWIGWKTGRTLLQEKESLPISKETAAKLKREWNRVLANPPRTAAPTAPEAELLRRIREITAEANRNNVTRTRAYGELYRRRPELHWAFLAHMVSRNAGWSMTDLQGELLPRLLNGQERRDVFHFLERANALIFQDAYPQLLLYEESLSHKRPLFHLLPHLHVSAFMRPVWELFWDDRTASAALTVCLVINEQQYIEGRVVQNGYYKKQVLDSLAFQTQSLLQLNQVLFPYRPDEQTGHRLAGAVLQDFSDVKVRIGMGKTLYALLFNLPGIREGAESFAAQVPHTGSRSDYNPKLFSKVKKAPPSTHYTERLEGCRLKTGAPPLYSPPLSAAWKDLPVEEAERYDWFRDKKAADAFGTLPSPDSPDMTAEACAGLRTIELAVLAAEAVGLDEED